MCYNVNRASCRAVLDISGLAAEPIFFPPRRAHDRGQIPGVRSPKQELCPRSVSASRNSAPWLAEGMENEEQVTPAEKISIHTSRHLPHNYARSPAKVTPVGFEPTPLRNGALSHRLRPLGQSVLGTNFWR